MKPHSVKAFAKRRVDLLPVLINGQRTLNYGMFFIYGRRSRLYITCPSFPYKFLFPACEESEKAISGYILVKDVKTGIHLITTVV